MQFSLRKSSTWRATLMISVLATLSVVNAYRPTQHCKMIGDNGHYSACASITQYYNPETQSSDLYLRYHWYRYKNSNKGWHAFALGGEMAGAMMLIMYGDPVASPDVMTISVRSATGHHPPLLVADVEQFKGQAIPVVDVVTAKFEPYVGDIVYKKYNIQPSHVGIAEVIIRDYSSWAGAVVSNASVSQNMLWSSNFQQGMEGDYSNSRSLEMHQFGLGFGFLKVDLLNAETPQPMFGPIDELAGLKGVNEIQVPTPPTAEELAAGQLIIDATEPYLAAGQSNDTPATTAAAPSVTATRISHSPTASAFEENKQEENVPPKTPEQIPNDDNNNQNQPDQVQQPARTVLGKSLRDWMWHLHGILMILAFLVLYPLGTYLIRSGSPTAFNTHWTVQALASMTLLIGSAIGYINSHSISITHQYIGLTMVFLVATQLYLGWRHHVQFVTERRKGIFSRLHIYLGRAILPLGAVNIILGMLLRQYGWFTITLVILVIAAEAGFLFFVLKNAMRKNEGGVAQSELRDVPGLNGSAGGGGGSGRHGVDDGDAEEFFQLAPGEDDEDESDDGFSDVEADADERKIKQQEKDERARRLARLDKM